jgi:hypothetical protein
MSDKVDQRKNKVTQALLNHHEKDMKELNKINGITPKRKHTKPEKEVEKACMDWMRSQGFNVQVIDSSASWNGRAWTQKSAKQGTVDCLGNTADGTSVAVEFKAKGKLSSFHSERNQRQVHFIIDKIDTNCFACVVDSVERLARIYNEWLKQRAKGQSCARAYLLSELP